MKLARVLPVLLVVATFAAPAHAQHTEEAVLAVVEQMFDGMRANDSTMVRTAFAPNAQMATATAEGLRMGSLDRFVSWVGSEKDYIASERTWDEEVRIDGNLATAWTPYALYIGERFSHCGVNSFQMVHGDNGWKIVAITDSRHQTGCDVPDHIKP